MHQFVLIIILCFCTLQNGYGQNQAAGKMIVPHKKTISLLHTTNRPQLYQYITKTDPVNFSLLHFNDKPLLLLSKAPAKPVMLFTELSFSDILENSINGFKINLLDTNDDMVSELFCDAPSLFKIKCVINL
jgi:hypothetical protein